MLAQQFAHEPDATNVLIAVFLAESESLAQMRADHVAIEHLDGPAAPLQFLRHQASKGGLAGTWKPGKPDGKTAVSSKCLHTVWTAKSGDGRRLFRTYFPRYASRRISATSGLVNSTGSSWPLRRSSRTLVPLRIRRSLGPCEQVFSEAT